MSLINGKPNNLVATPKLPLAQRFEQLQSVCFTLFNTLVNDRFKIQTPEAAQMYQTVLKQISEVIKKHSMRGLTNQQLLQDPEYIAEMAKFTEDEKLFHTYQVFLNQIINI